LAFFRKLAFVTKIGVCHENRRFCKKFRFFAKIGVFVKISILQKSALLAKIGVFRKKYFKIGVLQNQCFCKIGVFAKIGIFRKKKIGKKDFCKIRFSRI
jgi:hypothetical protein